MTFFAIHQPGGVDFACSDCLETARAELIVDAPDLVVAQIPRLTGGDCCSWCGLDDGVEASRVDAYLDELDERSFALGREWG